MRQGARTSNRTCANQGIFHRPLCSTKEHGHNSSPLAEHRPKRRIRSLLRRLWLFTRVRFCDSAWDHCFCMVYFMACLPSLLLVVVVSVYIFLKSLFPNQSIGTTLKPFSCYMKYRLTQTKRQQGSQGNLVMCPFNVQNAGHSTQGPLYWGQPPQLTLATRPCNRG